MNEITNHTGERWGMLANGSSARWGFAVDECLDREEWTLEIESQRVYLVLQLEDLGVPAAALSFLQSGLRRGAGANGQQSGGEAQALVLGRFGNLAVSLDWDDEEGPRCFLVIGPHARAMLRLSLDADDIHMWIEALHQVIQDVPQAVAK
jgi:hypothetical protein